MTEILSQRAVKPKTTNQPMKQRTTCIKAPKWPPTKLTHIVMNNSCVVPLTETGMEFGDRHYIWG